MIRLHSIRLATLVLPVALAGCTGDDSGSADSSNDPTENGTSNDPTMGMDTTAGMDTESGGPAGCADPGDASARTEVATAIDGDTTWTCDHVYVLTGITFVNSGTLTIEPGTTVLGGAGSALVIDKGATIDAVGTADAPIVMTSISDPGSRQRGDWGGLVMIGTAPTNVGEGVAEGFADDPPTYGGQDAGHNCGSLSYLRVEWAGNEVSPGNELNGITFYACGTATSVDHVQVHMGSDDGMEMFGGAFDASYIVITGAADDSVDCDQGFRGNLQHVFVQQDPTIGDNCLEWSNQGNDFSAEPLTGPSIANLTCVGSGAGGDKSKGVTLKEGTQANVMNSLFAGITNEAVVLANQATQTQAEGGAISFSGTHFCDANAFAIDTDPEDPDPVAWTSEEFEAWILDAGAAATGTACDLPSVTWGSPNVQPPAGSAPDGAGGSLPNAFDATTYSGAVDPNGDDWTTESWINFEV